MSLSVISNGAIISRGLVINFSRRPSIGGILMTALLTILSLVRDSLAVSTMPNGYFPRTCKLASLSSTKSLAWSGRFLVRFLRWIIKESMYSSIHFLHSWVCNRSRYFFRRLTSLYDLSCGIFKSLSNLYGGMDFMSLFIAKRAGVMIFWPSVSLVIANGRELTIPSVIVNGVANSGVVTFFLPSFALMMRFNIQFII